MLNPNNKQGSGDNANIPRQKNKSQKPGRDQNQKHQMTKDKARLMSAAKICGKLKAVS